MKHASTIAASLFSILAAPSLGLAAKAQILHQWMHDGIAKVRTTGQSFSVNSPNGIRKFKLLKSGDIAAIEEMNGEATEAGLLRAGTGKQFHFTYDAKGLVEKFTEENGTLEKKPFRSLRNDGTDRGTLGTEWVAHVLSGVFNGRYSLAHIDSTNEDVVGYEDNNQFQYFRLGPDKGVEIMKASYQSAAQEDVDKMGANIAAILFDKEPGVLEKRNPGFYWGDTRGVIPALAVEKLQKRLNNALMYLEAVNPLGRQ